MEHTKGEISITDTNEHGDYYIGDKDSHSYIAIVVADVLIAEDIAEANAKEIVRRWNAFEKDGIVDELRAAIKKTHKEGYVDGYVDGVATDGCVENNIIDQDDWAKAWNQSDAKAKA